MPSGTAPGYRSNPLGTLLYVGDAGYGWSSAVSRLNGMFLHLTAELLLPSNAGNRAHGFQLRCLSE